MFETGRLIAAINVISVRAVVRHHDDFLGDAGIRQWLSGLLTSAQHKQCEKDE